MQLVVATWDDSIHAALYRHHMIRVIGAAQHFERLVENLAVVAKLYSQHYQGAAMHVPSLAHPRHLQAIDYLPCRQYLRIDEHVHAKVLIEQAYVLFHVFGIVDLRHRFLGMKGMSKDATVNVLVLVRRHRDEEVGVARPCLVQRLDTRRRPAQREQVVVGSDLVETVLVFVDDGYLFLVA